MQEQFHIWQEYWGELICDNDERFASHIYGFENFSLKNKTKDSFEFTKNATIWGFVESGTSAIESEEIQWSVHKDQWFCVASNKIKLNFSKDSRVFLVARYGYHGLNAMGGPIEKTGRLSYIDGCTDTLLAYPVEKGDPCLNLLHFPTNINQTMHTHPSTRAGIVSSGEGQCITETQSIPLTTGSLFYLPRNTKHNFKTESSVLNVISYHPDSDWGPTHEIHPMINRTWVDGKKIKQED